MLKVVFSCDDCSRSENQDAVNRKNMVRHEKWQQQERVLDRTEVISVSNDCEQTRL